MPELPQVQPVVQSKPIDLSGQSKKALEIKSTIAEIKSPIAKSGVFTKMLESLTKIQQHLQKIRDFAAAKTDVKFNEKTQRWHSPLDSNKMVKGVDERVVAVKEKAQEEAIEEDALRAEKLPDDTMVTKKEVGLGNLAGFLKEITTTTKEHLELYKKEIGGDAEEDLEQDKKDEMDSKNADETADSLKGIEKDTKENKVFGFFKKHWGKLLLGVAVLVLPLKDMAKWVMGIWDFTKEFVWPAIKEVGEFILKSAIPILRTIAMVIGKLVDFFFGSKATEEEFKAQEAKVAEMEKDKNVDPEKLKEERATLASMGSRNEKTGEFEANERQGGVMGKGGAISSVLQFFGMTKENADEISGGIGKFVGLLTGIATLLAVAFPMTALKMIGKGIKGFAKIGWSVIKGSFSLLSKGARGLGERLGLLKPKVPTTTTGAKPTGTPKTGGAKPTGTPKTSTPKTSTPKPTGKPPTSKLADTGKKMGKWAKKFPKLAKSMKFLTKIPFIGKLFLAGPLIYALATGAGKKEIAPIIGQIFGGVGGAALGGMLGGLIGAAGGPVALITAALGGIAGAMVGDTLGTALAQWLVGEKVDAFGWGFGWINDIINGGKGPAEGGANLPTPPAADAAGAETPPAGAGGAPVVEKPPRTDFKVPDTGVTATSSESFTTGVDVGTESEKIQKNIIKFVQIHEEKFKKAKRNWAKKAIARKVSKHLRGPHRELVLEELEGTQLEEQIKKMAGGLKGPADLSKVAGAKGMLTPSGGLDMQSKAFSSHMGIEPNVAPSDKTAALSAIHTENATLKGQQADGGSAMLNAPVNNSTTNNNGTTMVVGSNTAQGGMKLDKLLG